jgi:phage gpG-like protein
VIEVIVPDTAKLERDLGVKRSQMLAALKTEITRIAVDVTATVKGEKLSGQALKVQSGRLRRSINYRVATSDTGVDAKVGTNVEYARVHEFGFKGAVNVREHIRKAKGKTQAMVRAHTRNVNMPERSFLRSTLREMKGDIDSRIARVVAQSIARGNGGSVA